PRARPVGLAAAGRRCGMKERGVGSSRPATLPGASRYRRTMRLLTAVAVSLALPFGVSAAERGTPGEARAMLAKAVAHYKSVGRKQALADFNSKKAPFSDRDLYVFCVGPDHVTVANGGFPSYVGTSVDALKDADGKDLGKALLDAAGKNEGS